VTRSCRTKTREVAAKCRCQRLYSQPTHMLNEARCSQANGEMLLPTEP
jgi:hypothetical protein